MRFIFSFLLLLIASTTLAYPAFVSYGYKNCMTCHYNGQGSGPLNDYGRALFSQEIASRSFYSAKTTDEELGESSGFLGKTSLPYWLRPGIKYRGLYLKTDPGSEISKTRVIHMQGEANLAVSFDQDQKYVLVGSYGYVPTPQGQSSTSTVKYSNWLSREHYFRWQVNDAYFVFLGSMDKTYGIRIIDHTAYSRLYTGNAQNDQTHGVMVQHIRPDQEITGHVFVGNLAQDAENRQKGFSAMYEKDLGEFHRVGTSALMSNNSYVKWTRLEGHSKFGFGKGNSLLTELGLVKNEIAATSTTTGVYAMIEANALMARGYNFVSQIDYYNQTTSTQSPDLIRWSAGLLMFPAPRYEFRTFLVNGRAVSDSGVSPDQWALQAQLHLSL
jgi:hypothetical protein